MERSDIFVLSMVAVVAVVGLATMFLQGGAGSAPADSVFVDEEGNVVGEAIRYRQFADAGERVYARQAYNPYAAKSEADRRETFVPGEQAYNSYAARPEADRRQTFVPGEQAYNSYAARPEADRRQTFVPRDGSRERIACPTCNPLVVRLYEGSADTGDPGRANRIVLEHPFGAGWDNLIQLNRIADTGVSGSVGLGLQTESGYRYLVLRAGESEDIDFGRVMVNIRLNRIDEKNGYIVLELMRR